MATLLTHDDRRVPHPGLHPLVAGRWSPRSFDPTADLDPVVAERLLEAARWAPSASNSQPWRFILAPRGSEAHTALLGTLMEFNKLWATHASALVLIAAHTTGADGSPLRWAQYDAGQAAAHLTAQAHADGLHVHQMGGFDPAAVSAAFGLPADIAPLTVVAVGTLAAADRLPEALAEREQAPRVRHALADLLLPGSATPSTGGYVNGSTP